MFKFFKFCELYFSSVQVYSFEYSSVSVSVSIFNNIKSLLYPGFSSCFTFHQIAKVKWRRGQGLNYHPRTWEALD